MIVTEGLVLLRRGGAAVVRQKRRDTVYIRLAQPSAWVERILWWM